MQLAMNGPAGRESEATRLMTTGGDARIRLDAATGLNRYFSAPRPSPALAYASSTSNDISAAAFARAQALLAEIGAEPPASAYSDRLEAMRGRVRKAYSVADEVEIVFAPSGTDLEYVALACAAGKGESGIHNILLGADEVGSGCASCSSPSTLCGRAGCIPRTAIMPSTTSRCARF